MIRLFLVVSQKSLQERLNFVISTAQDFDLVGMVDNLNDAIDRLKSLQCDVMLIDIDILDLDRTLLSKILDHSLADIKILALSSHDHDRSIDSGIHGYIFKDASIEEIHDAIQFVSQGYAQIAPYLFRAVSSSLITDKGFKSMPSAIDFWTNIKSMIKPVDTKPIFKTKSSPIILIQKSISWYQIAALLIATFTLTIAFYFVRQNWHLHNYQTPKSAAIR